MTTLKYPLEISNGTLVLTEDEDRALADAIKSAVLTNKGERIMRPDYGISGYIFDLLPDVGGFAVEIEGDIDGSLTEYPEIVTQVAAQQLEEGRVNVSLLYNTDGDTPTELSIIV